MHQQSTPTALPAQPAGIDLSANGVEAIVAALNAAGLTVHYTETDGDHALDLHLRPVDEDVELVTLSWRQDRQGWYVAEHDAAGVQQSTRPLGDMDLEDVAAEAARILAQIERAEAQIRAEAESSTTPPETERTIKARYLRPEHRLVLEDVEQDRDTITARLAGGASVEYDADEAVTVADPQPTGRLLAAVRAVIDAGRLSYDGSGTDVDRIEGEAYARLVAAYEAVTGGTADTALTVRDRLAAELHRIADDIVRLDLPVGRNNGLGVGVLDSRADLDRWAAYLGSAVQVDSNGIPHVAHDLRLGDQYEELAVTAQTNRDPRSEVERLRAENAELLARLGGVKTEAGGTR
ncbi:hypothetical protein ACFUYE_00455 [Micromonospora humida]|uniref:hypothetical protein n=1 Tax=Micromonospora humida TaxID=2809018 RepID=UPI00366DE422